MNVDPQRLSRYQRLAYLLVVPWCSLLLVACGAEEEPVPEEPEPLELLYFETLVRGNQSTLTDTTETVLRTAEAWETFRENLRMMMPPQPVDFDQTMLLVIAIPVETGGYLLEIESVEYDPGREVIVTYVLKAPGGNCLEVVAETAPFVVVAARVVEEPVRFVRRVEFDSCR